MTRPVYIIIGLFIIALLQACASSGVAPVSKRGEVKESQPQVTQRGQTQTKTKAASRKTINKDGFHIVASGDTLYSIAWRYDFDYKEVANWNNIDAPYTIYPGQFIRLKPTPKKKGVALKPQQTDSKSVKKASPKPAPKKTAQKKSVVAAKNNQPKAVLPKGPIKWSWPTTGDLVKSNSPTSKKGIDIAGRSGQVIKAAAAGQVVYSGSGLLGYGKLIIIKHSDAYLSAYAYNSKLLVKEGDNVVVGQAISNMGQDHTGRHLLHFEIRQNGKPVDPKRYLPKKRA